MLKYKYKYKYNFLMIHMRLFIFALIASLYGFVAMACTESAVQPVSASYHGQQNTHMTAAERPMPAALYETAPCNSENTSWSVLPDAWSVASVMARRDTQILDIRGTRQRQAGMLPQTTAIEFAKWRDPAWTGLPASNAALSRLIGAAGLLLEQPIVLVVQSGEAQDMARAAFVYWVLKSTGARNVAILHGGFEAWKNAGLSTYDFMAVRAPYDAEVTFGDAHLASDYEIYGIAMMQMAGQLVDVRAHDVVNRFDSMGRAMPTTLPGARSAPVEALMEAFGQGQNPETGVAAIKAQMAGIRRAGDTGPIISFSSTGELAALSWFFTSEVLGMADVRVYAEGIKGWKDRDGALFRAANVYQVAN